MNEISAIIRARLDEGRAIADEDVRQLLAERDELQARVAEIKTLRDEIAMQMMNKLSLETRLDWLEADVSAQRTAILKLEQRVVMLAGAVVLAGIVALVFKIALEVLT